MRTVLIAVAGFAAGLMIALFFRQAAPQQAFTPDPVSPKRWPSATLTGALSTDDVDERWDMGLRAPLAQTRLPAGADCEEAYRWAQQHGAVPLGDHEIDLRVEAHRDVAVRLLRIEVRQVTDKSGLYLPGFEMTCSSGAPEALPADVELRMGTEQSAWRWPTESPWLLRAGDSHVWQVGVTGARAQRSSYYVLDVEYALDGERYETTLDDDGKPFFLSFGTAHMGYSPPLYTFRRRPHPHFAYRPAMCAIPGNPLEDRPCEQQGRASATSPG